MAQIVKTEGRIDGSAEKQSQSPLSPRRDILRLFRKPTGDTTYGRKSHPDPDKEVDLLWKLGVRAVTPIHAVDSAIGSPAILNAPYNG